MNMIRTDWSVRDWEVAAEIAEEQSRLLGGHALRKLESMHTDHKEFKLTHSYGRFHRKMNGQIETYIVMVWKDTVLEETPLMMFEYWPTGTLNAAWIEFPSGEQLHI